MNSFVLGLAAVSLAYLLGSVSFAVLSSKVFGLADPRSYGSGNPGATNVLRSGHKGAALFTLIGDAAKGLVAVLLAHWATRHYSLDSAIPALCGLAAFVGHLFPLFHGFKGGKGVATAAGVLIGLSLWLGAATALTWAIIFFFFRLSSMAAIVSAVFAAFYQILLFGFRIESLAVMVMAGLLIYRHRGNIARMFAGQEARMGAKPSQLAKPNNPSSATKPRTSKVSEARK
jgi:acyl phosphate:glycerol-3-phosphate acyltransferase